MCQIYSGYNFSRFRLYIQIAFSGNAFSYKLQFHFRFIRCMYTDIYYIHYFKHKKIQSLNCPQPLPEKSLVNRMFIRKNRGCAIPGFHKYLLFKYIYFNTSASKIHTFCICIVEQINFISFDGTAGIFSCT